MSQSYLTWKALHVLGAILMLGNVIVTGAWTAILWRNRSEASQRQIAHGILWTDLLFTLVGGTLMVISGIQMIRVADLPWRDTAWLMRGIEALGFTALFWLLVLLPDQWRMERCSPTDVTRFGRLFRRWSVLGWLVTPMLLWGLWTMVTKPV